jgi:D-serine deaminase-like pyridoxal phosphate-dependent protein
MEMDRIETPAALVDVDRVQANLRRLDGYCRGHGIAWRPHAKTHKVPALAALQVAAGAAGLTVATPHEAQVMADAADDLLLAYPVLGAAKLARLTGLPGRVRLTVGLDSRPALDALDAAARAAGRRIGVLVELDVGMRRVGVQSPANAVELARAAAEAGALEYRGVMFYPGHIREPVGEQGEALAEVSARVAAVRDALEAAGLAPAVVSGGSTPTQWRSHEIAGLTEIRPGTSIFNDRATAAIGACAREECAYSVLATVVSTAVPGQAVVDAGSKALAREELRGPGGGYGALLDRPEVVVASVSEEHGLLDLSQSEWRPRVGERVRIVPNHVCVSVNLQEQLWAVRGERVLGAWIVRGRGRGVTIPAGLADPVIAPDGGRR